MRWTVAALVGACAGGVVWAVRRRNRRPDEPGAWSAATDTVAPARVRPA